MKSNISKESKKLRDDKEIDLAEFEPSELTLLNLAYTHSTRIWVNEKCQNAFIRIMKVSNDKLIIPDPKFDKNDGDGRRQTQYVKLCAGYPLVCWSTKHHNTTEGKVSAFGNIENSSRFEVVELRKETFIVKRVLKFAQQEKYKDRQDLMDAAENERFEFRYVDTQEIGGTKIGRI